MGLQPVHPRCLVDHLEEPSYRIFGHHALNLEQFRHHSIEANGVHAGRPTALAQHRENPRAQDVLTARTVSTGVGERTGPLTAFI